MHAHGIGRQAHQPPKGINRRLRPGWRGLDSSSVLAARNRRRWMAATRIVSRIGLRDAKPHTVRLHALTSFEFFVVLAEHCPLNELNEVLLETVRKTLSSYS